MLIKVKNPEIYKAWLNYFETHKGKVTAIERTEAFFESEKGIWPKCTCH